jgi:hypothetical protein
MADSPEPDLAYRRPVKSRVVTATIVAVSVVALVMSFYR